MGKGEQQKIRSRLRRYERALQRERKEGVVWSMRCGSWNDRMLSENANPELRSLEAPLDALGFRLSVELKATG